MKNFLSIFYLALTLILLLDTLQGKRQVLRAGRVAVRARQPGPGARLQHGRETLNFGAQLRDHLGNDAGVRAYNYRVQSPWRIKIIYYSSTQYYKLVFTSQRDHLF